MFVEANTDYEELDLFNDFEVSLIILIIKDFLLRVFLLIHRPINNILWLTLSIN